MTPVLRAADLEQLETHGISEEEAQRQLALFENPPLPTPIVRACTIGDGIVELPPAGKYEVHFEEAVSSGRVTKFVPASGAASRMFKALAETRDHKDPEKTEIFEKFSASLLNFPFADLLPEGANTLTAKEVLDAVLDLPGLGLAQKPKGLVPFHKRPQGGARTAFEEHLIEAALLFGRNSASRDNPSLCRLHFTISPEHQDSFDDRLRTTREDIETEYGVRFEVGFSTQSPATDTVAADASGHPFRTETNRLLLRPGGHGALIGNLAALARAGADLVTIKNIDNILPVHRQDEAIQVKERLIGLLVALEATTHSLLSDLHADSTCNEQLLNRAQSFVENDLKQPLPSQVRRDPSQNKAHLIRSLDRPLRVCGMVPNLGEPGGGPFWVEDAERGEAPQIVESSQIDKTNPTCNDILASATHFNPVELVCALRDWRGQAFDLGPFVDQASWFLSEKSQGGKTLQALERPGLWNGAMGGWNTIFVEVPASTFAPVKTVFDLLRPEHNDTP